jgi:hypothetical protein
MRRHRNKRWRRIFAYINSCLDDSYVSCYLMFFLQRLIIFSPFLTNPLHILKTLSKFIAIVNER